MMDEYLSNIYGTNSSPESLEKTAQAELLMKLAEEEGIDLSDLSEEQMGQLTDQLISDSGQEAGGDAGGEAPTEDEEAQAKFAEADFLGRVMAHSYTQELNKIAMEGGDMPYPADKKKCEDCKKEPCECPSKEAGGPVAQAIRNLGGNVGGAPAQEEVPDAVKLAFATLQAHGYVE